MHCREKVDWDLDGSPACEHLMDLSCSSQAWRKGHKSRAYGGAEPESFWVWDRSGIWGCKGGQRWIGTLSRVLGPCVAHPYPHLPLPPDHSAASDLPMLLSPAGLVLSVYQDLLCSDIHDVYSICYEGALNVCITAQICLLAVL